MLLFILIWRNYSRKQTAAKSGDPFSRICKKMSVRLHDVSLLWSKIPICSHIPADHPFNNIPFFSFNNTNFALRPSNILFEQPLEREELLCLQVLAGCSFPQRKIRLFGKKQRNPSFAYRFVPILSEFSYRLPLFPLRQYRNFPPERLQHSEKGRREESVPGGCF